MRKTLASWKKLSGWLKGFCILAFVFLLVGVGTIGFFRSTGKSYELRTQGNNEKEPAIVFAVDNLHDGDTVSASGSVVHNDTPLTLVAVYLNIGAIYGDDGAASIRLARSYTADGSYVNGYTGYIENFYTVDEDGDAAVETNGGVGNWVQPFEKDFAALENGLKRSDYRYYKLTSLTHNIVINEIVFVAEKLDTNGKSTGERVVMPASIYTGEATVLPREDGTREGALKAAGALLDSQRMPETNLSSFFAFSTEEVYVLSTVREIRAGNKYAASNTGHYTGDRVYGALGIDLITLGTLIFGMGPFGLRIFPMLASFGVLVLGFLLTRKLFKSDKAGFVFALLYALSNLSIGLGHLGTPLMLGVFFFVAAVYFMHKFYSEGMQKASILSAAPLALSGLFAACAILTNGAYVVATVGLLALFALGMVRQQKARRYHLDKAIAEAESAAEPDPAPAEDGTPVLSESKQKVANVVSEYRYKNTVAPVIFGLFLLLGTFLLSVLAVLPASNAYVKMYDNPAAPTMSVFGLGWKAFIGGFVGENAMAATQSVWNPLYTLFTGTGANYAVTMLVPNVVALLAALAGAVYGIYRIVSLAKRKERSREERTELRAVGIACAGLVLSLVLAAFAKGGLAFILLAYVFGFILCSGAVKRYTEMEGKVGKIFKIAGIIGIVLLAVCFLLLSFFTFSVPLPASFMDALFA